jgi:hypothetical protein
VHLGEVWKSPIAVVEMHIIICLELAKSDLQWTNGGLRGVWILAIRTFGEDPYQPQQLNNSVNELVNDFFV